MTQVKQKQLKQNFIVVVIISLVIIGLTTLYTVKEGQGALVLRLGEITANAQGQPVMITPGLHAKLPIVDHVRYFDVRLQTFDVKSSRILTKEQKYVLVDYYVKWRISDLPLYYTRTGGYSIQAERLLQQKINNALRAAFGERSITEVISERGDIMSMLKQKADESAASLGASVVDVRIKSIDLPKEVSTSVFERMRTEREQVATKHRSDGRAAGEVVRAEADAKVTVILAKAKADAERIRAEGSAKAAHIYANAYNKDPNFYAFYRSLEAYMHAFHDKHDLLLLKPDSQFFKYLHQDK